MARHFRPSRIYRKDVTPPKRVKTVAVSLLQQLKETIENVDHWREKETTRDAVYKSIHDFLYSDETGLPINAYTPEDVDTYTEEVFRHIYRAHPTVPSPLYSGAIDAQ